MTSAKFDVINLNVVADRYLRSLHLNKEGTI